MLKLIKLREVRLHALHLAYYQIADWIFEREKFRCKAIKYDCVCPHRDKCFPFE